MVRGERNNNPGNIDYNPRNNWVGQLGIEDTPKAGRARFAKFDTPENGIRALAVLLKGYVRKGYDTIEEIVNRYAPPVENKTDKYAESVSKFVGIPIGQRLEPKHYVSLVTAIIRHELGYNPYTPAVIAEGVRRAGFN